MLCRQLWLVLIETSFLAIIFQFGFFLQTDKTIAVIFSLQSFV